MDGTPRTPRADAPAGDPAADWLREAAEFLVHPQRSLTPPPKPELLPAYDTVLACRRLAAPKKLARPRSAAALPKKTASPR